MTGLLRSSMSGLLCRRDVSNTVWYLAGGAPTPLAVYQPIGAADYAASLINLANPGTNNAYAGAAPSWAAGTGWSFLAASSQYLKTGITVTNTTDRAVLIRFANRATNGYLFGTITVTGSQYAVTVQGNNGSNKRAYGNGGQRAVDAAITAGVVGFASDRAYLNGVDDGQISSTYTFASNLEAFIGCRNFNGSPNTYQTLDVMAFVWWSTSVGHATWMPAVSAAMVALTG